MAFGQSPGPPAGQRQVNRLLELLNAAGHSDFRDARGPLDLTQRQAAGRFTRGEADALIELLETELEQQRSDATDAGPSPEPHGGNEIASSTTATPSTPSTPSTPRLISRDERRAKEAQRTLRDVSDEVLATELQRRGWVVMEP